MVPEPGPLAALQILFAPDAYVLCHSAPSSGNHDTLPILSLGQHVAAGPGENTRGMNIVGVLATSLAIFD